MSLPRVLALLIFASIAPLTCAQTLWNIAGAGDWFTAGNWTAGVPNPAGVLNFDARVDNGGTPQINTPGASVRRITLGALPASSGNLFLNSAGTLNVTQNLHLGENGSGSVTDAGAITTQFTRLGRFTTGSGTANVTGASATWSSSADFLVGEQGPGTLNLLQGGHVTVGGNFTVADSSATTASNVSLTDTGSTLTVSTGSTVIGNSGNVNFTIDKGATVNSQDVLIASLGGVAIVTVNGSDSTWNIAKASKIGVSGNAQLSVTKGGLVHVTDSSAGVALLLGYNSAGVGEIHISGAGSLVDCADEVGAGVSGEGLIDLSDGGMLNIANGTRPLLLATTASSQGYLNFGTGGASGTLTASSISFGSGSGHLNFDHTGTLTLSIPIFGNITVSQFNTGTTILTAANAFSGTLTATSGKLIFEQSLTTLDNFAVNATCTVQLTASGNGTKVFKTKNFNTMNDGKLDLTDNKLIVSNGILGIWNGTKYTGIMGELQTGYNGGLWNGIGIDTSLGSSSMGLGAARADDIGLVGKTFGGVTVKAGEILVGYTLAGDANIDGTVDFADLVQVAQNYGKTGGAFWYQGNFNYDDKVDFADLVMIAQNYGKTFGSPLPASLPLLDSTSVPEPIAAPIVLGCMMLTRRRSRSLSNCKSVGSFCGISRDNGAVGNYAPRASFAKGEAATFAKWTLPNEFFE